MAIYSTQTDLHLSLIRGLTMLTLSILEGNLASAQSASFPQTGSYSFSFESQTPADAGWTLDKWVLDTVPETGIQEMVATGTNAQFGHIRPSSSGLDQTAFGGAPFPLPPVIPAASHRTLGFGERWLINSAVGNATDPGNGIYEQHNSGRAILRLTDLPQHSSIDLAFLLAIGDSFDTGNSASLDGAFEVVVDGTTYFSHLPARGGDSLVGSSGVRTLASEANLGFAYIEQWSNNEGIGPLNVDDRSERSWTLDAAYDVAAVPDLTAIPHTADSLTIEFIHRVSSAPTDEHLAIDHVRVEISNDDDGMPASWEAEHGLDAGIDDSKFDTDLDGRTNLEEFRRDSDPRQSDSPFLKSGKWNVRQIRGVDEVRSLTNRSDDLGALDLLEFGLGVTDEESRTQHEFINFKEQEFQQWLFPESEKPFPLFGSYVDDENDHILEATGDIYVRESGEVILGFSSDDGAILFIDDEPVLVFNETRRQDTSHAKVFLTEGIHHVRFVTWNRDGTGAAVLFYGLKEEMPQSFTADDIALLQPFDPFTVNTGDSDNDGMDDFSEVYFFGDLLASATGDHDKDGTSNLDELSQGTSPTVEDSDSDGLTDTEETTIHGTDPRLADTDGDGANDALEIGFLLSNPLVKDTDGDGYGDFEEAKAGTAASEPSEFPGAYSGPMVRVSEWEEDFDQYENGTVSLPDGAKLVSNKDLQGVQNGTLQLSSDSVRSQRTYYKLPNQSLAETGFEISFDFKIADAEGGNPAADGFSFNYGPIILNEWAGEEGFGKGLSVEFDTWDNSAAEDPAENGYNIAIDGEDVPGGFVNEELPIGNEFHTARIAWLRTGSDSGVATLEIDGRTIFDRITTAGFNPHHTYVMAFAARTAGATEDLFIDNLKVKCPGDQTDQDGDGLLDLWELAHFGNLTETPDADGDSDNLTNLEELQHNTNPALADSDGDNLSDSEEINETGTDPANPDTDGDGFSDGSELAGIPSLTSPVDFDSDGDGYGDHFEWEQHTDPNDSTSRPTRLPTPVYSKLDRTWRWRIDEVQVVWNHGAGIAVENDWLFGFTASNADENSADEIDISFRRQWDGVTYVFSADSNNFAKNGSGFWHADWAFQEDKTRSLGFAGTGSRDVSHRLSFRCTFSESPHDGTWGGIFEVVNMDTGKTIAKEGFSDFEASPSIQDGTAKWETRRGLTGGSSVWSHAGIDVYVGGVETTEPDTDKDGLSDAFESAFGLAINDPSDAESDLDGDGVSNLIEAQNGTRPDKIDSDGDGASDLQELLHGFSPLVAESSPLSIVAELEMNTDDVDGNGLSDLWELAYQRQDFTALLPDEDADGDGASNLEESIAGTDPWTSDSRFALRSTLDGEDLILSWPTEQHKRYDVQSSTELESWESIELIDAENTGNTSVRIIEQLASDDDRVFYRVNAGDRDSDNDGLSDWAEAQLGTDTNDISSAGASVESLTGEVVISGDYRAFLEAMRPQGAHAKPTRPQAARFLQQASFGPTLETIEEVQQLGFESWIDRQMNDVPTFLHEPYIEELWQDHRHGLQYIPNYARGSFGLPGENATTPFIRAATQAEDQLRQRVAFALSQILVVSRQDGALSERPQSLCNYYDIFVRHAFGNYHDILREVALHPIMGRYLSHVGNEKANPDLNQFPDENFAREVKQLFTIGLWELNPDGTRILDKDGEPIATYGNREITEFARVFTGLWYADRNWGSGGWADEHFLRPMQMHPDRHDFGLKILFHDRELPGRGPQLIPARTRNSENGISDVEDALSVLFHHPNTPPFICRQLIQFLVTANPSPDFVERIQDVFVNDGSGERGNLGAVTRAILLDREARNPRIALGREGFGKLKEPLLRATALARAFRLGRHQDLVWHRTSSFYDAAYQAPLSSPTVFNFFRPDYQAPGVVRDAGLASPVFQITDSYSAISFPNFLWDTVTNGFEAEGWAYERERFSLDYSSLLPLSDTPEALVDRLNLLFCAGSMTVSNRRTIIAAIHEIPESEPGIRAMLGAYLALMSPEAAVQR